MMKQTEQMIITSNCNVTNRSVQLIDYIPLQLHSDSGCVSPDYYQIRKGDSSLLELAFDEASSIIHRVTLLICEDFHIMNEEYSIPDGCVEGDILLDASGTEESEVFLCNVFPNAVRITLSSLPCSTRIRSGNVIWELTEQGELLSLCVIDPTGELSAHCGNELSDVYKEDSDWESSSQDYSTESGSRLISQS